MSILDIVFPRLCVGCGREGKYICNACQKKILAPEQICPMCCKSSLDGWTHPRCVQRDGMNRLIVGLPYRGVVQQCLKKVKYKSAWDIVKQIFELCDFGEINGMTVTPVPMWKRKLRDRGFNQADILSKLIARHYKVPSFVVLERIRDTKPMYGLSKKNRYANIENAFIFVGKQTPKRVLLVDDVWTTGATMRECARILMQAGVKEVWGLTLAR